MAESWLHIASIVPAASPSWMAPPPQGDGDRVSWSPRSQATDLPRASVAPPSGRGSMVPRSVIPSVPPPPPAIFDVEALIGPLEAELRATIAAGVASLERARRAALLESERGLVQLASVIAERVVGRELACDPALVARWAHEGIAALLGEDEITIVASPDVADRLRGQDAPEDVELEVDAAAPAGTCRIRGRWGSVDASMRARLDATFAALEPPDATEDDEEDEDLR